MQGNGARLIQIILNENAAHAAIESGNLNVIKASVCPVKVAVNPVDCQAIRSAHIFWHHCLNDVGWGVDPKHTKIQILPLAFTCSDLQV